MMQDELGSIMKFCYALFPVKVYTAHVPERIQIPAIYFPTPLVSDSSFSMAAYQKNYRLYVKFFHTDSQLAFNKAEEIADRVRVARNTVPLLNPDGSATAYKLQITHMETRALEEGVAQLTIEWESQYDYDRAEVQKIQHLFSDVSNNQS
jgi:hypothetical protein